MQEIPFILYVEFFYLKNSQIALDIIITLIPNDL